MRKKILMVCTVCARRNYRTSKGQAETEKLLLKKYCKFCFKSINHRELIIK